MANLVYIISGSHNYNGYIPEDAGPSWSSLIGIPHGELSNTKFNDESIYIVDPLLSGEEVSILSQVIQNTSAIFALRVIDPGGPPRDTNAVRALAFEFAQNKRVAVISPYQPTEISQFIYMALGPKRFHVSPYPYDVTKEVDTQLDSLRANRLIITGANDKLVYPLRHFARHKRLTNLKWRAFTTDLRPMGYRVANSPLQVSGSRYINYLARHSMMFLCPSRSKVELLKYRECAYAGCMPVGLAPDALPGKAKSSFVTITPQCFSANFNLLTRMNVSEVREHAQDYRKAMRANRMPEDLLKKMVDWALRLDK